jgi:hypothetical protein
MCFPSVVFFPSPYLFVVVIIMSSLYILHQLCFRFAVFVHFGHYSDISCFFFQFPLGSSYSFIVVDIVSFLYIFSIHCVFPFAVFVCHGCHHIVLICFRLFHYLCFPLAVFVHCGHNSNLVDESGFYEEINYVHSLVVAIFQ